jgi:hypothetical protein
MLDFGDEQKEKDSVCSCPCGPSMIMEETENKE